MKSNRSIVVFKFFCEQLSTYKLSIGDKLEVLYTDKLDVGSFEIEELYDVDTNQEIPTINPGKKGQKVKIKIPFENLKSGIVIRRKK